MRNYILVSITLIFHAKSNGSSFTKYSISYLENLIIPLHKFLKIQDFILIETLFVILTIPLVVKNLTFHLYRIHNIQLLHPILKKSFQYEIEHRYFAIRSYLHYITIRDDENVLCCVASSEHFSRLDTALHAVDKIQECSYFQFEDDKEKMSKYGHISILSQTRDQAISIDKNFSAITTLGLVLLIHLCLSV